MMNLMDRRTPAEKEPALAVGVAMAALLSAFRAMGWLTPEQEQAWLPVVLIAAPLLQAAVTRRFVRPAKDP